MNSPYLRFTNGVLSIRGIKPVRYEVELPKVAVQTVTVPVLPETAPAPEPAPVEVVPEPLEVEAPLEVADAPTEAGLVPEDPPA